MNVKMKSEKKVTVLFQLDNTSRKIATGLSGRALASKIADESERFMKGFTSTKRKTRR